jgi:glycosyltransferase involved in cell wall biosynthesis
MQTTIAMRPETLCLPARRSTRIAIDLRSVGSGRTDRERCAATMLVALERAAASEVLLPIASEAGASHLAAAGGITRPVLALQALPQLLSTLDADVLLSPRPLLPRIRIGSYICAVDDAAPLARPDLCSAFELEHFHAHIDATLRNAAQVLTLSEASKEHLLRTCAIGAERVRVVRPCAGPVFRRTSDGEVERRVLTTIGLDPHFILYSGPLDARGNLPILCEAYSLLRNAPRLVVAGDGRGDARQFASVAGRFALSARVQLLDSVPPMLLRALLRSASIWLYPVLHEGTGVALLEAMACGTPVVTSDLAGTRELVGDAAVLVDPLNAPAFAEAIRVLLQDRQAATDLSRRASARAATFTLEHHGRELLSLIRSTLAEE